MRCAACRREMLDATYILTRTQLPSSVLTVNLCGSCVADLLGAANRRRLDTVLVKSGWVERPLPGFERLAGE